MLNAAAYGVSDSPEYKVQSVQMAPGKRGERPPSYRSMNKQMNKRLSDAEPKGKVCSRSRRVHEKACDGRPPTPTACVRARGTRSTLRLCARSLDLKFCGPCSDELSTERVCGMKKLEI